MTTIGNPRYSEIASAVNSREWTNDTWIAIVSRRRNTGRVTAYCGRYLAWSVRPVCTASFGIPVVPLVWVISVG